MTVAAATAAPSRPWYLEPYVLLTAFAGLFLALSFFVGLVPGAKQWRNVFACVSMLAGAYYVTQTAAASVAARRLDVNVLMILAAVGAVAIGEYLDGAVLIFLFSLSNTLESFTMARTRDAIKALLKLRPDTALVRTETGDEVRPIAELVAGDVVVIRPGDLVPVDGEVVEGIGCVNEASMTGEAAPVDKTLGSSLLGGTLNLDSLLIERVTRPAKESALSKVIALVQQAQSEQTAGERLSEWIGRWYTWAVLAAFAIFFLDQLLIHGLSYHAAFYRAVVLLVAASPCALVMATPSAVLSALANCARRGILVRGGMFLEVASKIRVLALDKTGTLTSGKFAVVDVRTFPNGGAEDGDRLIVMTAAAERMVSHPVAEGITAEARRRGLEVPIATDVRSIAGLGIEARLDGKKVLVGRDKMFQDNHGLPASALAVLGDLAAEGKTVVGVVGDNVAGVIALRDNLRPQTVEALKSMRQCGIEHVVMLTGDNDVTAKAIAKLAGVDEYFAGLMPGDKSEKLRELRERYGPVAMVGDGVNDAPCLASADLGIAMGGIGSDVAMETADVVLMNDRIERIPDLFRVAQFAMRVVRQNLAMATVSLLTLVVVTLTAGMPLPLAVVGHEATTVLVMLNGVRLLAMR